MKMGMVLSVSILLGVFMATGAVGDSVTAVTDDDVQAGVSPMGPTGPLARRLHHRCEHPRGGPYVGECAAYCQDLQSCNQCCSKAYPLLKDQDKYLICSGRCFDVF